MTYDKDMHASLTEVAVVNQVTNYDLHGGMVLPVIDTLAFSQFVDRVLSMVLFPVYVN